MRTAVGVLLLAAAINPAFAWVPDGSYLETCANVRGWGGLLMAECQGDDGSLRWTVLRHLDSCIGDIWNDDGRLSCVR